MPHLKILNRKMNIFCRNQNFLTTRWISYAETHSS